MATIRLKDFKIGYSDQFFFDTNVWLILYGTFADYHKNEQRVYSDLLEQIITYDKPIFFTAMILSEFSNVILRRDFKQWTDTNNLVRKEFKRDFVGTAEYKNSVETITASINRILKLPNLILIADSFNAISKDNVLNNFKIVDLNDAYFAELAIRNNYKVVTNDRDFQKLGSKIDVLTALAV